MKVLITGATGFIGSRLAAGCLGAGHAVRALGLERTGVEVEHGRRLARDGAEVLTCSVTERERVFAAAEGVEVVFHLAAAQHEAGLPDRRFWEVNVEGTRNVMDGSVAAGVRRVVHGSTIGVYGGSGGGPITEASPLEPDNIYGVTKLAGEEVVRSYARKLEWAIARIAETYGPGDRRLLKLFRGIKRGMLVRIGPGENLHHLVYIDDLLDGLLLASTAEEAIGRELVIAGKRPVPTREMFATVARSLGVRGPRLRLPLAPLVWLATALELLLRPLGVQPPLHRRRMDFFRKSYSFSGSEARDLLGYNPQVGFEQGAARTAAWYADQGLL